MRFISTPGRRASPGPHHSRGIVPALHRAPRHGSDRRYRSGAACESGPSNHPSFSRSHPDADGTLVGTDAECQGGFDIAYDGIWGYHPLLISLANTAEPLYLVNRSGNPPSHEQAAEYLDKAIDLCRRAGFRRILVVATPTSPRPSTWTAGICRRHQLRLRVRQQQSPQSQSRRAPG